MEVERWNKRPPLPNPLLLEGGERQEVPRATGLAIFRQLPSNSLVMSAALKIQVDSSRLQLEIDELAAISEQPPPVVTRVLFSDADRRAREFVRRLCRDAGLVLREDAIGNLFARWPGKTPALPPVATGSHIDAIPNAGRYDGIVGVLGAVEAIRSLRRAGFEPLRPVELIVFTAEEPTRFGIGCLGSRVLSGVLASDKADNLRDAEGVTL